MRREDKKVRLLHLLLFGVVILLGQCAWTDVAAMGASEGSAIVGIVTPYELFLFTDSARSTIGSVPGASAQRVEEITRKTWKLGRVIVAQAGLRSIAIRRQEYDFTDPARHMLQNSTTFDPVQFSKAWKADIKKSLLEAEAQDPAEFDQLLRNGVRAVELMVGWFDPTGSPHLRRLYIGMKVSANGRVVFEDHDSEIQGAGAGRGSLLLGAEAADVAPKLNADRVVFGSLTALMAAGRYSEAASLIIDYTAKHSDEVGGPVQMVNLLKPIVRSTTQ